VGRLLFFWAGQEKPCSASKCKGTRVLWGGMLWQVCVTREQWQGRTAGAFSSCGQRRQPYLCAQHARPTTFFCSPRAGRGGWHSLWWVGCCMPGCSWQPAGGPQALVSSVQVVSPGAPDRCCWCGSMSRQVCMPAQLGAPHARCLPSPTHGVPCWSLACCRQDHG